MVHIIEEIWRFKGLGLVWAIVIGILIVALKYYAEELNRKKNS